MLDGILGRGFASKCKSLIKTTKNRIDVNRRKKNATLKFLKKDMADLLANGLDINAYGRAEGLLDELRQIWCYDFIEQCCDFLLKHLSILQKIRHCPEDCREAVSCLMFAAARFSDLPELRDLRDTFYERYGSTVELFVNQEFVENSCTKPSTKEKKYQLLQDISSEFSIKWDRRACEQMMSRFPASAQDQPKTYGSAQNNQHKPTGKETVLKGDEKDLPSKEPLRHDLDGHRFFNGKESNVLIINELNHRPRHEVSRIGYKPVNIKEETLLKEDALLREMHEASSDKFGSRKEIPLKQVGLGSTSQRKKAESGSVGSKLQDREGNVVHTRDGRDTLALGKTDVSPHHAGFAGDNYGGQNKIADSTRDIQEHEVRKSNPYYNNVIPPPYIKSNAKPMDSKPGASLGYLRTGSDGNVFPKAPSLDNRNKAVAGSDRVQQEAYHLDHSRKSVESARENGGGHESHKYYQQDGVGNSIPKPRSMRRKHAKSHSSHNDANNMEDTGGVKRTSRSRRRNDSKKGLQILVDDDQYEDEEERMIDKLLLHYSKKPAGQEPGKLRRESRSCHVHSRGSDADKSPQHISRNGPDETLQRGFPPRSISLPNEQTAPSGSTKTFMRVASFQSEQSTPARHVHPKLPDYDDLAARFTALKGR